MRLAGRMAPGSGSGPLTGHFASRIESWRACAIESASAGGLSEPTDFFALPGFALFLLVPCFFAPFFEGEAVLSRAGVGLAGFADESCCAAAGRAATVNTKSARWSAREITKEGTAS